MKLDKCCRCGKEGEIGVSLFLHQIPIRVERRKFRKIGYLDILLIWCFINLPMPFIWFYLKGPMFFISLYSLAGAFLIVFCGFIEAIRKDRDRKRIWEDEL